MKRGNRLRSGVAAVQYWIFGAALALLGLWVTRPFLEQIAFAGILAVAVWPLHQRILRSGIGRNRETWVSLALVLAIGAALVLPFAVFGAEAVRDSSALERWIEQVSRTGAPSPHWLVSIPFLGTWLQGWWQDNLANPQHAQAIFRRINLGAVTQSIGALASLILSWAMFLFVTLLALFVFLHQGAKLGAMMCTLARRLYGDFGERFVSRLGEAIRGTVTGTVWVSLGEGLLIGFGYAIAGLPHPFTFAIATLGFAFIPFGAWVAFGAASLLVFAQGSTLSAIVLFGYSSAVMLIGDNLVQPAVIGSSIRLPFLWTFVGIFGGLYSFGLVGLFIGPAIMAAVFLVWNAWWSHDPLGARR